MEDKHINKWSNSYSVGINLIDEQHRELFSMINTFYEGCFQGNEKSAREFFERGIHNIVNYIKYHFSTEEKLLGFIDYPGLVGHKQQHAEYLKSIVSQTGPFETGTPSSFRPYVQYLRDKLFAHITSSDKEYGAFLQDLKKRTLHKKKLLQKAE